MPKRRYNAEEMIHKLREADFLLSQEMNLSQVCKRIGIANHLDKYEGTAAKRFFWRIGR